MREEEERKSERETDSWFALVTYWHTHYEYDRNQLFQIISTNFLWFNLPSNVEFEWDFTVWFPKYIFFSFCKTLRIWEMNIFTILFVSTFSKNCMKMLKQFITKSYFYEFFWSISPFVSVQLPDTHIQTF